jgi:hypothetical protein
MEQLMVTLDTGVFNAPDLARVKAAASGLPIDFAHVSVTARELENATRTMVSERQILETGVWDESRWDQAVYAVDDEPELLEQVLKLISGGGFPKTGKRENLSHGHQHMLRDAMILQTYARDGHDILVSKDTKAYGKTGSPLRTQLEALCATRIMTIDEFVDECSRLKTGV